MMQFMADYMFQDGTRDAILYVSVTYDNDTTISKTARFASSGLSQLRIPEYDHNIKKMRGFFYLSGGNERTTSTRLLFLNNIQLIRFHSPKQEDEAKKDSIESDTNGGRLNADSLGGGDSRRGGAAVLSLDSGTSIHRVVKRPRVVEP
jgi:hypothetical protein